MNGQRKFEEFQIRESIGVGTVGTIYEAEDLVAGQTVALKVLLPAVSSDPLISARFQREMLILEKLSHPNIVRYYGGGKYGQQFFYAMELLPGGSLKQMLTQSGRLSWREAATMGAQVCSALQHAHNYGIIHRDLKPANLLFTSEGVVKLSDFGIARDVNATDITSEGLTVGSYYYMPPEQIHGERHVTGQADLYAFGCVLFEALTASPPYPGDNFAQIFQQHLHSCPPSVRQLEPGCPEEIDPLIQQLLAKRPADRPFNARAVQGCLLESLQDEQASEHAVAGALSETVYLTEDDVPASQAISQSLESIGRRIERMNNRRTDVSWPAVSLLFAIATLVALAAWYFAV